MLLITTSEKITACAEHRLFLLHSRLFVIYSSSYPLESPYNRPTIRILFIFHREIKKLMLSNISKFGGFRHFMWRKIDAQGYDFRH